MAARVTLIETDEAPRLVRHLFEVGDPGVIARAPSSPATLDRLAAEGFGP